MSRAIGRVVAPFLALGIVVLVASLLASSDLMPRTTRPAAATPQTTTATTIIEFVLPAAGAEAQDASADPSAATGERIEGDGGDGGSGDASAGTGSGSGDAQGGGEAGTATSEQTYTVQAGDSPYLIAQKFGVSTLALMEVNGITDPTDLRVGAVLRIPAE